MRKPNLALSLETISNAALACLDECGFAGFSLRGVARALGVFPGALYWHVPGGREALLAAAAGAALVGVLPVRTDADDWRDWLRRLFRGYRDAIRAHPNVAPVLGSQLVSNSGIDFDLIETILGVLGEAGFAEHERVTAYNVVIAAMVGFTTLEFAPLPADDPDTWQSSQRARMQAVDASRYPLVASSMPSMANRAFVLRWQNGTEVAMDDGFDAFVDCVIEGLARRIRSPDQADRCTTA